MGESQVFFNAPVDRVTVMDNFQVLDLAAGFSPAQDCKARRHKQALFKTSRVRV